MSNSPTLQDRIESLLRDIVTTHMPEFMTDEEYAPGGADAIDYLREIAFAADDLLREIDNAAEPAKESPANALVRDIPLMFTGLSDICEEEPGYLLGEVCISGVKHHAEFVRVEESDSGLEVWKSGEPEVDRTNAWRLHLMTEYCAGQPRTVEVRGFEGRFVCLVSPYSR